MKYNNTTFKSRDMHLPGITRPTNDLSATRLGVASGKAWVYLAAIVFLSAMTLAASAKIGTISQTKTSTRLYTAPDPSAKGGIHGRLKNHSQLLLEVFAVVPENPNLVYRGEVSTNGYEFSFTGLPVAKYDLMLVGQNKFYEGFRLTQVNDTLTPKDNKLIEAIVTKSVPFFNVKKTHRCQGTTGQNGKARCMLQEARTLPITLQSGEVRRDIQIRSIRLALLEDIGATGWQLVTTREIVRMEVGPADVKGILPHAYLPALGQIRVMDEIKELEEIDLAAD